MAFYEKQKREKKIGDKYFWIQRDDRKPLKAELKKENSFPRIRVGAGLLALLTLMLLSSHWDAKAEWQPLLPKARLPSGFLERLT